VVHASPYIGIFLLLLLGGVGLPFPEDGTLLLSGALVSHGTIHPLLAFLTVYPVLLATDLFIFFVGQRYGRRVVLHQGFRKIISPAGLAKFENIFKRRGTWVVFLGRHIIGIRAQIMLAAGVTRMSVIKFLVADAATALLTILFWSGIGFAGHKHMDAVKTGAVRFWPLAVIPAVLLISALTYSKFLRKRLMAKPDPES
jgi:membrane protein DedA with SNARE-associated domain